MNPRDKLEIDIELFLEDFAPGEWERFGDLERAFDFFTADMSPQALIKALDESGCRNEAFEEQQNVFWQWVAAIDADDPYIEEQCHAG